MIQSGNTEMQTQVRRHDKNPLVTTPNPYLFRGWVPYSRCSDCFRNVLGVIPTRRRKELLDSAGKISGLLAELTEQAGLETLSADILKNAYSYLEGII